MPIPNCANTSAMLCPMTDEQKLIFDWIGNLPVAVPNWDERLPKMYQECNAKWFDDSLPALGEDFVCEFCEMPRNTAGIFIDTKKAEAQSTAETRIRSGIRINAALQVLPDHVKIALLHEMIHASGIDGHREQFNLEISRLLCAGAYKELL